MGIRETLLKLTINFSIADEDFNEWAKRQRIFFILAIERSGIQLLANLLNQAPGALVGHEPVRAYQVAFHNPEKSKDHTQSFRSKEIYLRVRKKKILTYGEMNSLLRRHVTALRDAFVNSQFIHLIRDGRDVIRSMTARKTMTAEDLNTRDIYPKERDPWKLKWSTMSRFKKMCRYWQTENVIFAHSLKIR